ncbi:alpha/beta hydrolase family protein [Maribacter aestuarii]|uniref:alpha/beta hydrolase family protein n=1 Tax=Maribacter aestuarii TaxID=1130723 RepID=UPI0025A606A5|nr:alpha/beta fold hydrolase [Maribacter aestuarii]
MKKIHITCAILMYSVLSFSQDITGIWNGTAKLGEDKEISFIFNIKNIENEYVTEFSIPKQRVTALKPQKTTFENGVLLIDGANLGVKYEGKFNQTLKQFEGTFTEGVNQLPLNLKKGKLKLEAKNNRPQEPVKPYPYNEEEVVFENKEANVSLVGTLTIPKKSGKSPAVILISGSGPQDRDETFANHKLFWIIADHLTRQGIAVLRFDDRGVGKSTGNFSNATTKDFSTDVVSAVKYLKSRADIDANDIGLIGHSEGGIIAPLAANQTKGVSFMVLLASTGIPGSEISLMQSISMRPFPVPNEAEYERAIRKAIKIASSDNELSIIKKELTNHYNKTIAPILEPLVGNDAKVNEIIEGLIETRTTPWVRYFYNYNPATEIEKLKIPVLSLNGSKDTQVKAKINQNGIRQALIKGGNQDYKIIELENLNHFFQECETGKMDEYQKIEQTFSPIALKEISSWILEHVN